jgi:hypothetical protein
MIRISTLCTQTIVTPRFAFNSDVFHAEET